MDRSDFAFRDAVNAAQTAVDDAGIETHKNKKFNGTLYEVRAYRGATQKQGGLEDHILGILKAAKGVNVIRVSTNQFSIMFEVDQGVVSPLEKLTDGDRTKNMLIIKKLDKNYDMRQESNNKRPLSEQDDEEAVAGPLQEGDWVLRESAAGLAPGIREMEKRSKLMQAGATVARLPAVCQTSTDALWSTVASSSAHTLALTRE